MIKQPQPLSIYLMVSTEPAGKQQTETHLFTHSNVLCVCVCVCLCVCVYTFVCVTDIPGQRPWNLTWFNNVTVSALCCIVLLHTHTHTHTHIHTDAVCGEGYRVEQLFFFRTDWPSRLETHTTTDIQTHKHTHTQHTYTTHTHTHTHIYAAISSGQYDSICLVQQAVG